MKRFRNADGKLNVTFEELKTATAQEAATTRSEQSIKMLTMTGNMFTWKMMIAWHTSRALTDTTYLFRLMLLARSCRMSQMMIGFWRL